MATLREIYDAIPKDLSHGEKLFYLFLHSRIVPGQSLALGEKVLAKEAGLGRKIVANAKKALALANLIKITSGAITSRSNPDVITLLKK